MELRSLGKASLALMVVACGSTPPATNTPPPPTSQPSVVASAPPPVAAEARTVLAEAAAPGDIVVQIRWKQPRDTISTLAAYAGLRQEFVDAGVKGAMHDVVRQLLKDKVNAEELTALVDADAPIDLVVAVDAQATRPEAYFGVSIGVTSLQKALATSNGKPKKLAEDVWQLGSEDSWGAPCALLASTGRTPARIVCGDRGRDLTTLGPYMARTLPAQDLPGGDIHGEVRLRGLLDKYGQQIAAQAKGLPQLAEDAKIGVAAFDEALMDAAAAIGDEAGPLARDLDTITIDGKVDAQNGLAISAKLGFAGKSSWLVQTLIDGADLADVGPDVFWRAPKGAATGAYGVTGDPSRFDGVLKIARSMLEGKLTEANVATDADRKAIAALVRMTGAKHVALSTSNGYFDDAGGNSAFVALVNGMIGWHLIGVDQEPKDAIAYLNEAVKVYNRPTLAAWLKKELGSDAKFLPTVKTVPAPAALGAGALDVEIAVDNIEDPLAHIAGQPRAKPKTLKLSGHILVMGDGKRTWIGMAADRDKLAKLMAGAKGATPGADTLSSLATLGAFKRDKHNGAAFLTLAGTLGMVKPFQALLAQAPASVAGPANKFIALLGQLPNKGATPIVVATDVTDGAKPSTSFTVSVPKEALYDIGFVTNQVIAFATSRQP